MGLESLVCEKCGGHLIADPQNNGMMKCESCRSRYKIKSSNIEVNNYTADTFHADVINIVDDESREAQVKSAESSLSLGKYDDARSVFSRLTKEHADDYRGWLGLVKVDSENFSKMPVPKTLLTTMEVNFENARKIARMANAKEFKSFEKDVETYFSLVQQANKNEIAAQNRKIAAAGSSISVHEKNHNVAQNNYKSQIEQYESKISTLEYLCSMSCILIYVLIICGFLLYLLFDVKDNSTALFVILLLAGWIVIIPLCKLISNLIDKLFQRRIKKIQGDINQCKQSASKEESEYNSAIKTLNSNIQYANNVISTF